MALKRINKVSCHVAITARLGFLRADKEEEGSVAGRYSRAVPPDVGVVGDGL